jgi:stage V sporulation protein R
LKEWQRNLIRISEENSSYFIPQALTKIMNEGWAVLIHEKIIQDLVLPDKYHLPFIKLHNQVIRPHIGQINPYFLGYHLFKEIEKKHGFEECLLVREVHNDATFIRKYLTQEVCDALNLFTYSYKKAKGYKTIDDVSDDMGWENIRDHLIKNIGLGSVPIICVEELTKQHSLILRHEHDGRDLDIPYAKKVHHYIEELWGDEVKLFTILEGDDWEF